MMMVAAAILAGGRGKRLGNAQKALVEVGGTPIVARQLAVLKPLTDEQIIVAGDTRPYEGFGARLVTDLHPGAGPLAGIESALAATKADALLVFACDLPFLDAAFVTALRDAPATAEAVVARLDGKAQPLAARYARSILPRVQRRLSKDKLRMLDLVAELDPEWLDFPAGTRALYNVNTPEELARAEELAKT